MEPKSGTRTTEFFALGLAAVVVVSSGFDKVSIDPELLKWFLGTCAAYIGQRGWVKSSASKGATNAKTSS